MGSCLGYPATLYNLSIQAYLSGCSRIIWELLHSSINRATDTMMMDHPSWLKPIDPSMWKLWMNMRVMIWSIWDTNEEKPCCCKGKVILMTTPFHLTSICGPCWSCSEHAVWDITDLIFFFLLFLRLLQAAAHHWQLWQLLRGWSRDPSTHSPPSAYRHTVRERLAHGRSRWPMRSGSCWTLRPSALGMTH